MKRITVLLILLVVSFGMLLGLKKYTHSMDFDKITQEAIASRNALLCDSIHVPSEETGENAPERIIAKCYENYVKIFPEENVCSRILLHAEPRDTIKGHSSHIGHTLCVDTQATSAGDASVCLQIDYPNSRSYCVSNVARLKNDVSLCNVLPTETEKQMCFNSIEK